MSRKPTDDPAAKRSISLPAWMYRGMLDRMASLGITSESAYIQLLVRRDLKDRGAIVIHADESASDGKITPLKAAEDPESYKARRRRAGEK